MKRLLLGVLLSGVCLFAADNPVTVDNNQVRILKVVDVPHHQSPRHRHELNRVMIYLNAGDMTIINEAETRTKSAGRRARWRGALLTGGIGARTWGPRRAGLSRLN